MGFLGLLQTVGLTVGFIICLQVGIIILTALTEVSIRCFMGAREAICDLKGNK